MYQIDFSGTIGEEISPGWLKGELKNAAGGPVQIDFNSPGGSVFAGREIRHALVEYPGKVTARVILAASMASDITTAADEVIVFEDSIYMLHRASGLTAGNAEDHREMLEVLEKLDNQLAADYARKSGKSVQKILSMMSKTTWLTGEEALAEGFADRLVRETRNSGTAAAMADGKRKFAACYHRPEPQEIAALFEKPGRVPLAALWERPELFQDKDDPDGIMTIKH